MSSATIERVETPRTVCERIRIEHVPELLEMLRDPRVAEYIWPVAGVPSERSVYEATADKERHWEQHGFGLWVQRDRETGELVGRGGLQWTHVAGRDAVEVAWAVTPERWGEGLATELARASVDTAFGPLGLDEIIAFTLPHNIASRRVMEKTGFELQEEIRHGSLPHVLYRLQAPGR